VFMASDEASGAPAQAFGVTAQDLTPELAEVLASPGLRGALVTDVDRTSPARKLHRADVVTGVDGEAVRAARDLVAQLERGGDGQAMRIAVQREGKPLELRLRVAPAGVAIVDKPAARIVEGHGFEGSTAYAGAARDA